MSNRQNGKSILQGMDFGKLEQAAILTLGKAIHDQIELDGISSGVYTKMQTLIQKGWTIARPFYATSYILPEPHLKSKVDQIIDKFWAYPGEGHMYLYMEQLQKNPITRELFKSKSTTHHYPCYEKGSKY